mmetsp:Transcript_28030/g.53069  ORF Transcript_28030/g.53069 Transcript_28030/m.53069 type:complete len:367 (-) Transcript_28030:51-1151(-)
MDPPAPPTAEQEAEGKIKELQELVEKQQEEILALKEKYEPSTDKFRKAAGTYDTSDEVPVWVQAMEENIEGSVVDTTFNTDDYRSANRFKGLDYMHSSVSPARVSGYRLFETPNTNWFKVEGVVQFNKNCEGAKAWVHRGALCALMDDAANWAGYNVSGNLDLFSGFTRKVDVTISRPVRVDSVLKLVGQIMEVKRRTDVIIQCSLIDPAYGNAVHAKADCVFVMGESAAEMLEPMVAARQKNRSNSGASPPPRDLGEARPWSMTFEAPSGDTMSDPQFRPPNRVGRYGLGQKISKEVAGKIDERTARHYVPPSGSLIKNAEKATIKKKMQQEAERLAAQEEQERERAKNHPARLRGWGGNGGGSG